MKHTKRLLALLLALVMLCVGVPFAAAEDEPTVVASGTSGNVTWQFDTSATLTLSGSGTMTNYSTTTTYVENTSYTRTDAEDLELAYAVTVHKSQGSEFDMVVVPLFGVPKPLSYRNLLYTAVTRARRLVVIVGREECVRAMVDNNHITRRYSALNARLEAGR